MEIEQLRGEFQAGAGKTGDLRHPGLGRLVFPTKSLFSATAGPSARSSTTQGTFPRGCDRDLASRGAARGGKEPGSDRDSAPGGRASGGGIGIRAGAPSSDPASTGENTSPAAGFPLRGFFPCPSLVLSPGEVLCASVCLGGEEPTVRARVSEPV